MSSCSDEAVDVSPYLNGTEKTPIEVEVSVGTKTRAVNKEFEAGDKLLAYLRHVKWEGGETDPIILVEPEGTPSPSFRSPALITFKVNDNPTHIKVDDNTQKTASLTVDGGLYWDDFSLGAIGDLTHLRTDGHYLQSYYGYCYNGGTPSTPLTENTSVLGWTVPYDQSAKASGVKNYDLLWSDSQDPVRYSHYTTHEANDEHGVLTIPYTHAMSMVTVKLIGRNGFKAGHFANTWLELQSVMKKCTVTALGKTLSNVNDGGEGDENKGLVKMYKGTPSTNASANPICTYQAIVVPGTKLTEGDLFLKVYNADGNDYDVKVSGSMLTSWASGLTSEKKFQSGYNYELTLTIDKVGVTVESTLADWKTILAEGEGEVQFPEEDVTSLQIYDDAGELKEVNVTAVENYKTAKFKLASSFDLHDKMNKDGEAYAYATTSTYTLVSGQKQWVNEPEVYWPNSTDKYFFRALAKYEASTSDGYNISSVNKSLDAKQGIDLVWATTAAHTVNKAGGGTTSYTKGAAILPRTGDVPLAFEHIMSKVTFKLQTVEGDAMVDLTDAKITLTDLCNEGTVNIDNGKVVFNLDDEDYPVTSVLESEAVNGIVTTLSEDEISATTSITETIVLPQKISPTSKIIIRLKDLDTDNDGVADDYGSTYSLTLNTCTQTNGSGPIIEWYRGLQYEYTISLKKDKVDFCVLLKDWEAPVFGEGDALMDWE